MLFFRDFSCTSAKRLRPHFREHDGVVGVNVKRHCPRSPPLARSMQYLTRRNLLWASHIREAHKRMAVHGRRISVHQHEELLDFHVLLP